MFHLTAVLVCQLLAPVVIDGVDVTGWTPAQLWTRADEYFHAGAYDKAVRLQERIMVLDPGDVEAYTVAAWLTWSLGDEPGARQYLDRAVAANPNAWEAHWELGFHLFDRLGAATEALGPLSRAVALPGCSDPAYRTLAHAYLAAERPSLAVALWTRIAAEQRAPPPVLDINLNKAWSQALRSDSRARAGGVVRGPPADILPVLLDEQRLDDDADGLPDRRTQLYADPTGARDRVAFRITATGYHLVKRVYWRWTSLATDLDGNGTFDEAETLRDEDGDGIAESLPPLAMLQRLRWQSSPVARWFAAPDRYELLVGPDGGPVPGAVHCVDGVVSAEPAWYLATDEPDLALRLVLIESTSRSRVAGTVGLAPGVYCGNPPGGGPRARLAISARSLPEGRYVPVGEITVRGVAVERRRLGDQVVCCEAGRVTLAPPRDGELESWTLEPPEPPVEAGAQAGIGLHRHE